MKVDDYQLSRNRTILLLKAKCPAVVHLEEIDGDDFTPVLTSCIVSLGEDSKSAIMCHAVQPRNVDYICHGRGTLNSRIIIG